MYRPIALLLFLSLTTLFACQKDNFATPLVEEQEEPTPTNVPSALVSHFANFEAEAMVRGISLDLSRLGITAEFEDIDRGSVAGVCTTNGAGLRNITIDLDFWQRANNSLREMIVFHELGHCAIGRGHTESTFQNGICRSIMRSGNGQCRDAYNANNREYYLDELFSVE